MYLAAHVVIDGAVDEEREFGLVDEFQEWLTKIELDANVGGYVAEVYVVTHDHEQGVECECMQYLTDHNATYTFPWEV